MNTAHVKINETGKAFLAALGYTRSVTLLTEKQVSLILSLQGGLELCGNDWYHSHIPNCKSQRYGTKVPTYSKLVLGKIKQKLFPSEN